MSPVTLAMIGASNFFELTIAAAINLFGFESGAALTTVVGVLIVAKVMLLEVKKVNASKDCMTLAVPRDTPRRSAYGRIQLGRWQTSRQSG